MNALIVWIYAINRNLANIENPVPAEILVIAFPFKASTASGLDLQFSENIINKDKLCLLKGL